METYGLRCEVQGSAASWRHSSSPLRHKVHADVFLGRWCGSGKTVATYQPSMDMGAYVVIVNAEKVVVTGNKFTQKVYTRHTGRPGSRKEETFQKLQAVRRSAAACCRMWGQGVLSRMACKCLSSTVSGACACAVAVARITCAVPVHARYSVSAASTHAVASVVQQIERAPGLAAVAADRVGPAPRSASRSASWSWR